MYKKMEEDQLDRIIDDFFDGKPAIKEVDGKKIVTTLAVDERFRREIKACLRNQRTLHPPEGVNEPFYVDPETMTFKGEIDLTQAITFKNGIYHVLENRFEVLSPDIFITKTLPYNYSPEAECPLWLWFVDDIFNGDLECIELLRQWFGYNLIASNHMEQMMFIFGISGSGKSTVIDVLQAMLGRNKYYAVDIDQFTSQFGLESLVGKYALIINDDHTTNKQSLSKLLNRFKRITGQDTMNINRKYKTSINVKPTWRITYVGNTMPEFSDEPQALLRRINLLHLSNNYYKTVDGPDRTLKDRLVEEAPGIAIWAIEGLRRLLENGDFIQPKTSLKHIEDFNAFTNPLKAMIDDCCTVYNDPSEAEQHQVKGDWLFDLHKAWYEENNLKSYGKRAFGMVLHNLGLPIIKNRIRIQGERTVIYKGIEILPEIFKKYLMT